MISKKDGEFLRAAIIKSNTAASSSSSTSTPVAATPRVRIFSQGNHVLFFCCVCVMITILIHVVYASCVIIEHKVACPVCRDDFDLESKTVRLPCSHLFHAPCILPWIEKVIADIGHISPILSC
jgi:hypothetical protein